MKSYKVQSQFFLVISFCCCLQIHSCNIINMGAICLRQTEEQQQVRQINARILNTIKQEADRAQADFRWAKILSKDYKTMKPENLYQASYAKMIEEFRRSTIPQYESMHRQATADQILQDEVQKSCVVPEDELNTILDKLGQQLTAPSKPAIEDLSFNEQALRNPSMVMQMNMIYRTEFPEQKKFNDCIKKFFKWSQMAEQQLKQGFLLPLYRLFSNDLFKQIQSNPTCPLKKLLQTINDSSAGFVNMMIILYKQIYSLQAIGKQQNGDMFKYETLFNFTMTNLFNYTSIKKTMEEVLREKMKTQIEFLRHKMAILRTKPIGHFQIPAEFIPYNSPEMKINLDGDSYSASSSVQSSNTRHMVFQQAIHHMLDVSKATTPIGKVKCILLASKKIASEINDYYERQGEQAPFLDPDSITSIMMYIVVHSNYPELLVDIEIIENFSSRNCMNCVSGYYINVIKASFEIIMSPDSLTH